MQQKTEQVKSFLNNAYFNKMGVLKGSKVIESIDENTPRNLKDLLSGNS